MQQPKPAIASPDERCAPSRRQVLEALAAAGISFSVGSLIPVSAGRGATPDINPVIPRLREMRDAFLTPARARSIGVADGKLARAEEKKEDQFTYAVDVGQLLLFFAMADDKEPYLALRDFAVKELIIDIKEDPFTRGFVQWRTQPGMKPDASGTTEALRLAKGLWTGANTFGRPEDRDLAVTIIDGYGRHQNVDQGLWLIRNYFHFYSRAFANNSFIIDYDPDFLRDVAEAHKDDKSDAGKRYSELTALADHSYDVLKSSVAPCGLLYDLLQPELKTMYYGLDVAYFSPNDIIQLNNACATAATVARGAPEVGHGVLAFVGERLDPSLPGATTRSAAGNETAPGKLYAHYYGRTGEVVHNQGIGATEYCALVRMAVLRLAARPEDETARFVTGRCVEEAMLSWEYTVAHAETIDAWTASEMLLGLQAVLDMKRA